MKFSPETVRGSRHGKCREISGEILLLLFPQETKLESTQNFSRLISRHFSPDALQLQMPNVMEFFALRTSVLFLNNKVGAFGKGMRTATFQSPAVH